MALLVLGSEGLGRLVIAARDGQLEDLAQGRFALQPEGAAEGVVHESEPLLLVAAQNDIALVVEEIAIACLPLAHLPLEVAQRFDGCIAMRGVGLRSTEVRSIKMRGITMPGLARRLARLAE